MEFDSIEIIAQVIGFFTILIVQLIGLYKTVVSVRKNKKQMEEAVKTVKRENVSLKKDLKDENNILKNENKEIRKELSKINTNLLTVKEDTKHLKEIHKHRDFELTLFRTMKDQIYLMTDEIKPHRQALLIGFEKVSPIFKKILDADFNDLKAEEVFEEFKRNIYAVFPSIRFDLFNTTQENFQESKCFNDIKTELKDFSASLILLSESMSNGKRREKFQEICIDLIKNITKIVLS
jgi:regulator of replication initiation timing